MRLDFILRPAVELYSASAALLAAVWCVATPQTLLLTPYSGYVLALPLLALSALRLKQGVRILRFRRRVRHLPLWTLSASRIPLLPDTLFLGRGFRWLPTHTQRLYLCRLPQCEHWLRTDRPSASGGDPLLHGVMDGLPQTEEKAAINLHCDEFSELMGDEFIPLINKGGGAGVQVTAYTQTLSDIEARIGDRAKAGQVVGNFNSLIMMRVRETAIAELLTRQLPQVDVLSNSASSGVTDSADAQGGISFSSNTQDRVSGVQVPLLEPASLVQLPKGQAFALLEGGQLWKLRIPLPNAAHDPLMPESITHIARYMEKQYDSETTEKLTDDTPDTPPARER